MSMFKSFTIGEEIRELFNEYSDYQPVEYLSENSKESSGKLKRSDSCLVLSDGSFIHTKTRGSTFYGKNGQVVTAYALLKTGNFSGREVAKICKVSRRVITKLFIADTTLKCLCGMPLKFHKPHCKFRLGKNEQNKAN